MKEIDIYLPGGKLTTSSFVFPGGEIQVRVPAMPHWFEGDIAVVARLQSAEAIIQLDILSEIINRCHVRHTGQKTLVIPYFPYARQDRVMARNEGFSLKRIAATIGSLGFDKVQVCDPHSDVTPALIERCEVFEQLSFLRQITDTLGTKAVVVCPDAGAVKKAQKAAIFYRRELIIAAKNRNVLSGEITGISLQNPEQVNGMECLVVDDLVDGGRTFIELAKILRQAGAHRIGLYTTHGIYSNGLDVFDGLIDEFYTTDSFISPALEDSRVEVIRLAFNNKGIIL
jgi:ribose-phosphate pyrophosphokinase